MCNANCFILYTYCDTVLCHSGGLRCRLIARRPWVQFPAGSRPLPSRCSGFPPQSNILYSRLIPITSLHQALMKLRIGSPVAAYCSSQQDGSSAESKFHLHPVCTGPLMYLTELVESQQTSSAKFVSVLLIYFVQMLLECPILFHTLPSASLH